METILNIDEYLFHLINETGHNTIFDVLMPYLRNKYLWIPLYVLVAAFLIKTHAKKGIFLILLLAATVGICDTLSSKIIKPTVERLRPCNDQEVKDNVRLLVSCGGGKSFTSSHATNHFGVAMFLFFILAAAMGKWRWLWIFWAASICYAQVYVGVHYPFDVLGGAILGGSIGLGMAMIGKRLINE